MADETAPQRAFESWVPMPPQTDFPPWNLPYGAFARPGEALVRLGVAIGEDVLDVRVLALAGLFDDVWPHARALLAGPTLDPLLAAGAEAWRAVRARITRLVRADDATVRELDLAERALVRRRDARMCLPFTPRDFVDFYASLDHATNAGRLFRPGADPLPPNWRHLPVGYHGRSGTIVVGTGEIARPWGQVATEQGPRYAPTQALDFELELAFVTGAAQSPVAVDRAPEAIFGLALLCDWSARDVQAWEAQPLGPFLGKSFATSLGPWIVPLEALEPVRVAAPVQTPPPLPYLAQRAPGAYDLTLDVALESAAMRAAGVPALPVTRTSFRDMYWTIGQMLAHASANGASVRAGDVFGSGTISGATPGSAGCLLEATCRGSRPLSLPGGEERAWLGDGDRVTFSARTPGRTPQALGFGTLEGTIVPARRP